MPPRRARRAQLRGAVTGGPRYRFGEFVLSPRQRMLWRGVQPVPLIPRYFDVLLLLVVRRGEAVSKSTIFTEVWTDVIVSDGALAQAIRTLRRTLGDDSREPRFIRTVSRHGYQFVGEGVTEEIDQGGPSGVEIAPGAVRSDAAVVMPEAVAMPTMVEQLLSAAEAGDDASAREAAERLHALDTQAAVALLRTRPGHARALAYLRDARWAVATSGTVGVAGDDEAARTAVEIVRLRLADGAPLLARRCRGAAGAGAVAGLLAGVVGGAVLAGAPDSHAPPQAALALGAIGAAAGALGATAIVGGIAAAELVSRSARPAAVVIGATLAGGAAAAVAHAIVASLLEGLFGLSATRVPGIPDGLLLGAAAGLAYAATTRRAVPEGLAAPAGAERAKVVAATGLACAMAAFVLASLDRPLIGGLVHQVAGSARNAQLGLEPLGRLIGDPAFGPAARRVLASLEGGVFGIALASSLTRRRPPSRA